MEDLTTRLLQLPEPQCSPCREAAAEIEMLRQQWREMSSAMMELRRENARLRKREALWQWCAERTTETYGGCYRPEYAEKVEAAARELAGERRY